jgi:hypothetical protein
VAAGRWRRGLRPPAALDPADVPVDQLPVALLGAMRRFGPSWLRWLRAHLGGSGLTPARMQSSACSRGPPSR